MQKQAWRPLRSGQTRLKIGTPIVRVRLSMRSRTTQVKHWLRHHILRPRRDFSFQTGELCIRFLELG